MILQGTVCKSSKGSFQSKKNNTVEYCEFVFKSATGNVFNIRILYPKIEIKVGDMFKVEISVDEFRAGYYMVDKKDGAHQIEYIGHDEKVAKADPDFKTIYKKELDAICKKAHLDDTALNKLIVDIRNETGGMLADDGVMSIIAKQFENYGVDDVERQKLLRERNLIDLNEKEALELLDLERKSTNPNGARTGHIENYILHLRQMALFERLIEKLDTFINTIKDRQ